MIALLKNPRAGVLGTIPITMPLLMVGGGAAWTGMAFDAGTVTAMACVLGLAASGTVHMIVEFRRQLADGKSRSEAATTALAHCGPSLWQTSFIVGLGLLVLYSSELQPISSFGCLSASLVLTVLLTNLVLTPALLAGPLGWLLEEPAVEEEAHVASATVATNGEKHSGSSTVNGAPLPRPHLETAAVMRVRRVE